jgi:hypothetical protein
MDERCIDRMDLVFAVDSSGSLGEVGFATFKNFTQELTKRMLPSYFTWPAVRVGVVLFGNGRLMKQKVNGEEKTMVKPAMLLTKTGPVANMKKVGELIKAAKWQKGFSNMAQGIIAGCKMVQRRGRWWSTRKVVVISDGQPTFAFAASEAAQECKDRNVVIDFIVVNANFDKDNAAWDDFKKLPSFPWHAHTHVVEGLAQLQMKPIMMANRMLPRICPRARSVSRVIDFSASKGYALVHRGRDCANWWYPLGKFRRVQDCAAEAASQGFKSFVFQFHRLLKTPNHRYWCWTHEEEGKKEPTKKGEPFTPVDETCTCKHWYCTGHWPKAEKAGWMAQKMTWSAGYSHYMVVEGKNQFKIDAEKQGDDVWEETTEGIEPEVLMQKEIVDDTDMMLASKQHMATAENALEASFRKEGMSADEIAEARREFKERLSEVVSAPTTQKK